MLQDVFKRFNGRKYGFSYHADLRHTMRIDHGSEMDASVLEEAVPYKLSQGYVRGFVNREEDVVFLVRGDSITTTIPTEGLEFSDDDPECGNCGARVQSTCRKPWNCSFCGKRVDEEVSVDGSGFQQV